MTECYCDACGKLCTPHFVDEGIGSYEYWGCPGVDTRIYVESSCCGALCVDADGNELSVADLWEEEDRCCDPY